MATLRLRYGLPPTLNAPDPCEPLAGAVRCAWL